MYQISPLVRDPIQACYWFEWLLKFETICKSKKVRCDCERRSFAPVQDKFQMDVIWLIWEALLGEAKNKQNSSYAKIIKSLLELFEELAPVLEVLLFLRLKSSGVSPITPLPQEELFFCTSTGH